MVRFTGISKYVQLPAVTEHSFTLEGKIEKSLYHMLLPFLRSVFSGL